jgi:hypothetical protein
MSQTPSSESSEAPLPILPRSPICAGGLGIPIPIDVDQEEAYPLPPTPGSSTQQAHPPLTLDQVVAALGDVSPKSGLRLLQTGDAKAIPHLKPIAAAIERGLDNRTEALQAEVARLKEEKAVLHASNRRLRDLAVPTPLRHESAPRPEGFINNANRYPHFVLPHNGHRARARYVRVCPTDSTIAEATMGENDDVFSFPVHATPYQPLDVDEDEGPPEPLPEWFDSLLRGDGAHFRTLAQGAEDHLADWGVSADIARHRATTQRITDLLGAREGINAALAAQRERLDLIAFRLAAARAPKRLAEYEALANMAGAFYVSESRLRFATGGSRDPE